MRWRPTNRIHRKHVAPANDEIRPRRQRPNRGRFSPSLGPRGRNAAHERAGAHTRGKLDQTTAFHQFHKTLSVAPERGPSLVRHRKRVVTSVSSRAERRRARSRGTSRYPRDRVRARRRKQGCKKKFCERVTPARACALALASRDALRFLDYAPFGAPLGMTGVMKLLRRVRAFVARACLWG